MISYDICLSLSDLLHLLWWSLGLSTLLQITLFHSFLWLSCLCVPRGFPAGASGKDLACQWRRCKRCGFHPWVGKIFWRRTCPRDSPGGLQSVGSQRIRHELKRLSTHIYVPEEQWTEVHDIVQEAGMQTTTKERKCKKAKWLSEALQIAENRKEAKGNGEKERYSHLNAEFQRVARRDKKAFLSDKRNRGKQ